MSKKQVNRIDPSNDTDDEKEEVDQIAGRRMRKDRYRNNDPRKQNPSNAIHQTEDRRKGNGL